MSPRSRFHSLLSSAIASLLFIVAGISGAETLKIATVVPDGSSWLVEMRKAGDEIEQRTAGRVKLKFYPGGVMGNDKTVMRKMRAGQLQGGAFTSGALASLYPDIELYSLPLVFRSYQEVDYVRTRMDVVLAKGLEQAGIVALAISDGGFGHVMSQKPIRRVEDLKGAKIWMVEDDVMSKAAFDIAGVAPVPLPIADVYTALQTGLIDTVAAPPTAAIAFQWHSKVRYFTDVPLMYLTGIIAVDAKAFGALSPSDRVIVQESVAQAGVRIDRESRAGDASAREALKSQGIEFVSATSPEEVARWQRISEEALVQLRGTGRYSDALVQRVLDLIAEFRARPAQPVEAR